MALVEVTPTVREALTSAASLSYREAEDFAQEDWVPWPTLLQALRTIRKAKRGDAHEDGEGAHDDEDVHDDEGEGGPWLQDVCRDAKLCYPSPEPKPGRNPELVKRLEKIRADLEERKYADMVKDIEPTSTQEKGGYEYMSSYRDQLGLGLNTVAVMGSLFAFGYYVSLKVTGGEGEGEVVPLCCGLVGAFAGLLLETFLFMLRSDTRERTAGRSRGKPVVGPATKVKLKEQ
ncbi:hypothetical protein HOP50_05g36750 [Chloropicon primus]|uniref:Endoplasmic reticulum-based factor for assembly of V-ATPase n=1 Tax=Chloropicon primus TaxID=1764295 RepID=A0A5B8ML03_9CHLO|nr:hypothetical protein A3770_05p36650 [Chloropicon primus]UPR00361.1 hypothetical protein HOP50_05g36750 [Chloropicon primus]|mmetsp:Transcript_13051/g.36616  ORF Transcript_13051/g.36616 Transcript_13051/m.36616 type:complete len:232 (-) Transcript_13051:1107-1802(-)|eukprot:QDZ21147.1 hypothetical protein A3770_05p36650 [Chloropicon primus]